MIKRITPDPERARSLQKMAAVTLERIATTDKQRFLGDIVEDYYSVIHKLIAALLLMVGRKAESKGAHALQIQELGKQFPEFAPYELALIDGLRQERNHIEYDGKVPTEDYLERNEKDFRAIIRKLDATLGKRY